MNTFLAFLLFFPLVSSARLGISNGTNVADPKCQSGYHIAGSWDPIRQGPYCTPIIESSRCNTCKFAVQAAAEVIEPECKIAAEVLTPELCNFLCKSSS
jgi:hypothetical protein